MILNFFMFLDNKGITEINGIKKKGNEKYRVVMN